MLSLLTSADLRKALERDARVGLSAVPKWLPPKYFYDDLGSRLFDEITRLPEYYPTRAERGLLTTYADDIAATADCTALLELGSGSSEKTRLLLNAIGATGRLESYVPVDVSEGALKEACVGLHADYPELALYPAVADFDAHLADLPHPGRRLWALLGGTIGNYSPADRGAFLAGIVDAMAPGEAFLLGLDLVKDSDRLVRAYDDAAGVTAAFNRNVINVVNRELDGNLDADDFEHIALWDAENEWIEMRLRARRPVHGYLSALALNATFDEGEEMRTEISAKFRRTRIEAELAAAGLTPTHWWTDGDFALSLSERR